MKKIGVVVAATAALLLAAAPFAFADSQGQNDQHNDQNCGQDTDVESFTDLLLLTISEDRENEVTCTQGDIDDDDD